MEVGSVDPSIRFRCADPDHEGDRHVPLLDFHQRSCRRGGKLRYYYADHCRPCANRRRRLREQERRRQDPEYAQGRIQATRAWVEANPDAAKRGWEKYARSEKGKTRRAEYRATEHAKKLRRKNEKKPKARARQKRQAERLRKLRLRGKAHLPTEVVRPFLELLVREAGGTQAVDDRFGVPHGMVYDHIRCQQKACSDHLVARLCQTPLCSEVELRDRADEWAQLTGSDWPMAPVWHRPQPPAHFAPCGECGKVFRMTVPQNTRHRKGLAVFCTKVHASKHSRRATLKAS